MWLAYLSDPSDSGKIHNNVRERFDQGEDTVIRLVSFVVWKFPSSLDLDTSLLQFHSSPTPFWSLLPTHGWVEGILGRQ